jgi:hypothetical protein
MKAAALIGALSVSLYTLLFSCSCPHVQTHHDVFRKIGKMASALLHIHVVVPINISGLNNAIHQFWEKTELLKQGYLEQEKRTVFLEYSHYTKPETFFKISQLLDVVLVHPSANKQPQ